MCFPFSLHSSVEKHPGWFDFLVILNSIGVNVAMRVCLRCVLAPACVVLPFDSCSCWTSLHSCQRAGTCFPRGSHSDCGNWKLKVVSVHLPLMAKDVEKLGRHLLAVYVSSFVSYLFS